jgi:hypothetical protein
MQIRQPAGSMRVDEACRFRIDRSAALPNDGRYPVLSLDPRQRRKKTLEALVAQIESLSWAEPVLMIFEGCVPSVLHF